MPDLATKEALEIMAVPKQAIGPLVWAQRQNHAGHIIAASPLLDEEGTTMPGLTVVIEVRAGVVTEQCLYFFSLHKRIGSTTWRVYQLEVCPAGKRSHNGPEGALYGPHEHVGDAASGVAVPAVQCGDWDGCLAHFLKTAGVAPLTIEAP